MNDNSRIMTQQNTTFTCDVEKMSFEVAIAELEKITTLLEKGDVELDHAVKYYERACVLQDYCQRKLNEAQMKVEKLLHKDGVVCGSEISNIENLHQDIQ